MYKWGDVECSLGCFVMKHAHLTQAHVPPLLGEDSNFLEGMAKDGGLFGADQHDDLVDWISFENFMLEPC